MENWKSGYTRLELDDAQERYELRFPPDLIELLLDRQPAQGYAWNTEDERIRKMLEWPLERLLWDVEQGYWWPEWGDRPQTAELRHGCVQSALATKPRLIPLYSHRFIPELPNEAGNPVFSMFGFDTIYYGSNLSEYFAHEFDKMPSNGAIRHILFWSDIAENHDIAYAYYAASESGHNRAKKLKDVLRRKLGGEDVRLRGE